MIARYTLLLAALIGIGGLAAAATPTPDVVIAVAEPAFTG